MSRGENAVAHKKFADLVGKRTPEQRARVDAIKASARADQIAESISEVRKIRSITQTALADAMQKTQPTVSQFENAPDNYVATVRSAIEAMGGRLEMVAVFEDQRIAIHQLAAPVRPA